MIFFFFAVNEEDQIHQTFNGSNVNKFEDLNNLNYIKILQIGLSKIYIDLNDSQYYTLFIHCRVMHSLMMFFHN